MKLTILYKLFHRHCYGSLILSACFGFASQSANAQIPVTDGAKIGQDLTEYATEASRWIDEYAQYAKDYAMQGQQFQQQITQYQSTLSKLSSIVDGVNLLTPKGVPLAGVPADYLVEEACPTTAAGAVSSLIGMLPFNLSGSTNIDYREKQHDICVAMQQTRNQRFNESLKFLNETMPQVQELHAKMEQRRNETTDSGPALANITDTNLAQSKVDNAVEDYNLKMNGYDKYLETLQQSQVTLAQIALKGRRVSAMRTMVSSAALMDGLGVEPSEILP